jgi:hypothetical protein
MLMTNSWSAPNSICETYFPILGIFAIVIFHSRADHAIPKNLFTSDKTAVDNDCVLQWSRNA